MSCYKYSVHTVNGRVEITVKWPCKGVVELLLGNGKGKSYLWIYCLIAVILPCGLAGRNYQNNAVHSETENKDLPISCD